MTGERLLKQLSVYEGADSHEQAMCVRLRDFVESHDNCFDRSLLTGHVTGSALVLDLDRTHTLLTHHGKLDKWLQLGGHADGEANVLEVALREVREESGLQALEAISEDIFDVDIHMIPARGFEPEHFHYDIRYLVGADRRHPLTITNESKALQWVPLRGVARLTREESMLRMIRKALAQFS